MKKITVCLFALSIIMMGCTTFPTMGRVGTIDRPEHRPRDEVEIGKRDEGYIQEELETLDPNKPMKWPPKREIAIPLDVRTTAELGAYLMINMAINAVFNIGYSIPSFTH
jgi:hypothetical protein